MDNELKVIYNYKASVSDLEYNSRVCCGNTNSFESFTIQPPKNGYC